MSAAVKLAGIRFLLGLLDRLAGEARGDVGGMLQQPVHWLVQIPRGTRADAMRGTLAEESKALWGKRVNHVWIKIPVWIGSANVAYPSGVLLTTNPHFTLVI